MSDETYPDPDGPLVLLWQWRHGFSEFSPEDSLADAANTAFWASEDDAAGFECAEVIDPDGSVRYLGWDELMEHRPPPPVAVAKPPVTARVVIAPPPHLAGKSGARPETWSTHASWDEAAAEAAKFARLGDRVTVERV